MEQVLLTEIIKKIFQINFYRNLILVKLEHTKETTLKNHTNNIGITNIG